MRAVCAALGLSRSNVVAKQNRTLDWIDCRRSPPKTDDAQVREAIADVVKERATYGYRRVWARLRIDGHQINHKRVYRVMRDEGLLMSWVASTKGIDAALVGDLMMRAVEKMFGSNGKQPQTIEWLTDN